ncbi:MAG: O-antigen ligase family protein [Mucilaginibacter sp.]|uniref:O-antigen ligase family protein n=1 Tax=Mucilaginibacter sp. TaxID=1882438 RepID=UPI0032650B2C
MLLSFRVIYNKLYLYLILLILGCALCHTFVKPENIKWPYINGPRLEFYFSCLCLVIFSLCLFVKFRPINKIKINLIDILLSLSLVYIIVVRYFSHLYVLTDKVFLIFCLTILYLFLTRYISTINRQTRKLFYFGFAILILLSVFSSLCLGIFQKIGLLESNGFYFKITGQFDNPAKYSLYLSSCFPFILTILLFFPKKWLFAQLIPVSLTIVIISVFIVALTCCRSSWLGLIVSTIFLIFVRFNLKITFLTTGILLPIICLLVFFSLKFKQDSAFGRLTIWKVSYNMIKRQPVLGIGYGDFENQYNKYQASYFSESNQDKREVLLADTVRFAFNDFLQIFCEQGFVGLFLFTSLIIVSLRVKKIYQISDKTSQLLLIGSVSGLISIIFSGLFSYSFSSLSGQCMFYIYLSLISSVVLIYQPLIVFPIRYHFLLLAFFLFDISLIIFLYGQLSKQFFAYKKWAEPVLYIDTWQELQQLYPILNQDHEFIEEYTSLLIKDRRYKEAMAVLKESEPLFIKPILYINLGKCYYANRQLMEAEKCFMTSVNMIPNRFESRLNLAQFFFDSGEFIKCEAISNRIIIEKPKIPSYAIIAIKERATMLKALCENRLHRWH